MKLLGIETSCDETAAAVVEDGRRVLSSVVASSVEEQALYGGIVPEIASRRHIEAISGVVEKALADAGVTAQGVDAVAVTAAPGLIGALLVGVNFAKGLAFAAGKPLVPVHHLRGHVASLYLTHPGLAPPFLCLVASGGHCHYVRVDDYTHFTVLGRTVDDAAGEAFDKVAAILDLPYPGGPSVDRLARRGNPRAIAFKRSAVGPEQLDFSFSGIKTAVLYEVCGHDLSRTAAEMADDRKADVAASFQEAVVDMLVANTLRAAESRAVDTIILGGGVSANGRLREKMAEAARRRGMACHVPPLKYCTDNAAMVAAAAGLRALAGLDNPPAVEADPSLPLVEEE